MIKDYVRQGKKELAVLIDPDKTGTDHLVALATQINKYNIQFIFFGGSLLSRFDLDTQIKWLKEHTEAKVILFPGSSIQISQEADGILFLSLISGRNPDLLIGQQVLAAPIIKQFGIHTLSTGYMLIDGGKPTTASYISATLPIPADKPDIAVCTALAGSMLGLQHFYLDAGSGALNPVSEEMIRAVKSNIGDAPLIVGGGMRSAEAVGRAAAAGADIIVVGNAFESNPALMGEMVAAVHGTFKTQER